MTWTYSTSWGAARDKIRFLIGDTDTNNQMISDEEIAAGITLWGSNNYHVAYNLCEGLAAKYSFQVDTSASGLSVAASQRAQAFHARAQWIKQQALTSGDIAPTIYVGGVVEDDNETLDDDSTLVQPQFKVGIHDYDSNVGAVRDEDD